MTFMDELTRLLPPGTVFGPADEGFSSATSPENTSFEQRPAAVVRPVGAEAAATVATTIVTARQHGLRVGVQATGHGAGRAIGADTVLVDVSALDGVEVDAGARTVTVGAGVTWSVVQKQAETHGLLALSGTSPDVGVGGYTFAGGVGWLVRPFGLASASLRAVEFVDGEGRVHRADEASDDDALWSFRGGSPVGIAVSLEFDLFPVPELAAGYLLWPADRLDAVAPAWVAALEGLSPTVTSTLALLNLPPEGPFPDHLLGTPVVHLSYASPAGEADLGPLRQAVRAAAEPAVDTTGPADAAALTGIHLDPPVAVPARGMGRWIEAGTASDVSAVLRSAHVGDGLNMIEIRHVGSPASSVPGALTSVPAPFLLHAVGAAPDDEARSGVDQALARVEAAARPLDAGRSAPSFREGQPDAGDAFPPEIQARLHQARHTFDPQGVFAFHRAAGDAASGR